MVKLSVVVITFNEEKNLARCLQSVLPVADEMVVVDSFSTDKTKEIALQFGAKFIEHPFKGHIEQKNYAITCASFPHILSLDADEALDATLQQEILRVKQNWEYAGYTMNRLTNYCGKWIYHCGWYPDTKLRLWDSRLGKWGGINPHDEFKLFDSKQSVKKLKGNILHYSYYSINEHYKQSEYFSDIAAKAYYQLGKRARFYHLLFSPVLKFIKLYFLKLGFLDGKEGFIICRITAYATWLKYYKLKQIAKRADK
jgi:glycosyltransferase involved in cell wall biosynthesis